MGFHRKEQAKARKYLLKGKASGTCFICGREMLADLLIAGHIKKRSLCTDSQKRDITNNMMLCCKFGCDYLFEMGYIFVDKFGKLQVTPNVGDKVIGSYVSGIAGRKTEATSGQLPYFLWHQDNRQIK